MRTISLLLLAVLVFHPSNIRADPPATQKLAEQDHITIDLKRDWAPWYLSSPNVPDAVNRNYDTSAEYPTFTCNQTGARATFEYHFDLPIEMTQFPIFVLKYRAKNIDTHNTWTSIWIREGENGAYFPLIDFDKLKVDGQIHEIQVDLPKAPIDSKGTPFENGPVKGLVVSVMNKDPGEGSIELISAEFRSSTEAPHPQVNDDPITVHVTDDAGQAVKGALVIVDAERKDVAQKATTDAQGLATLVPIKNELNHHAVHVEADGQVPLDVQVDQIPAQPLDVQLLKPMQVGGLVEDANGKPLANAAVDIYIPDQAVMPIGQTRWPMGTVIRTNAAGQWIARPLPWSDRIQLQISSDDTGGNPKLTENDLSLDELRSGIATIRLKK